MIDNGKFSLILITLISIFIIFMGCIGSTIYSYTGVYSIIYTEEIPQNRLNDENHSKLINYLKLNFSTITTKEEYIIIDLDGEIYTRPRAYIYYLDNNSIKIESSLGRYADFQGESYNSESEAKENSKELYSNDKKYLKEKNNKILEIIFQIYNINITSESYNMHIGKQSAP